MARLIDADKLRTKAFVDIESGEPFIGLQELDEALTVIAIQVTADELRHLINDTISYIWKLEDRGCDKPMYGYDSRKALLEKLKEFERKYYPQNECAP